MVIDTSALVAVIISEIDAEQFENAIYRDSTHLMSAASVLEAAIVLQRRFGETGTRELDLILQRIPIEIIPVDLDQLEWARFAVQTFGRGRHPAKLNFGDCFWYALSRVTGEPLLYKGADFSQTDLASALLE